MQGVVAGVDVGGTRIKVGLADSSGRLLSCEVLETRRCRDAESFLETIAGEIGKQANAAAASARVAAVGIGCPGRIDFASGKVVWLKSKLEFLEGVPLAVRLRDRLGCPVVCDNDVNTILAGEMRFGAGQGYRDVAGVTVGTGIGGALVLRGCLVRGRKLGSRPLRLHVARSLGASARLREHRDRGGARLAQRDPVPAALGARGRRGLSAYGISRPWRGAGLARSVRGRRCWRPTRLPTG